MDSFVALGHCEFTQLDIETLLDLNLGSPTLTLPESVICLSYQPWLWRCYDGAVAAPKETSTHSKAEQAAG